MTAGGKIVRAGSFDTAARRPHLDLQIPGKLSEASRAVSQVGEWLAQDDVSPEKIGDITLVLAESLNNVIQHAYGPGTEGPIEVRVSRWRSTVSMQIVDSGTRFDGPPEEAILNTVGHAVADMPEGGFGWFLIKTLTDDIHFWHAGGQNKLTLVVNLGPPE